MPSKTKPRILYLSHAYFNRGGTEAHTQHLAHGLSNDFDIGVLTRLGEEICFIQNDTIIKKFPSPTPSWPVTPLNWPSAEEALKNILDEFSPDIIHIQHLFSWPLIAIDLAIKYGKPTLMTVHDYYIINPDYTNRVDSEVILKSSQACINSFGADITMYLKNRRDFFIETTKKLKIILAPSHYIAKKISSLMPINIKVIEHGIPELTPLNKNINNDILRFGFVGSLLPQKGWSFLVNAFKKLRAKYNSCELHFWGDSDQVTPSDKTNQEKIFFHGSYNSADLPQICSNIDVGIIPSVFEETFSLVLSELWMMKIPVAVSNIGTLGGRVIDGTNGKKFKPNNEDSLLECLEWFINNNEWRQWSLPKPRNISEMLVDYRKLYRDLTVE
jgi:glycosyltransferase involved in cell wall biosynthesis